MLSVVAFSCYSYRYCRDNVMTRQVSFRKISRIFVATMSRPYNSGMASIFKPSGRKKSDYEKRCLEAGHTVEWARRIAGKQRDSTTRRLDSPASC